MNDTSSYCTAVEDYLVRRNGGHLVRIVGPAFDLVLGWEARGIPLTAVHRGIDRYIERHEAREERRGGGPADRAPRRRPVRIEFCEADVLDVFDEWRKAVGLPAASGLPGLPGSPGSPGEGTEPASRHRESLATHLERVIARLTSLRASTSEPTGVSGFSRTVLDPVLDDTVRELDAARASAKGVRGEARQALLEQLRRLEQQLTAAAREALPPGELDGLGREADAELAPFRDRMPAETYQQSRAACIDRLVRERARLPVISLDA